MFVQMRSKCINRNLPLAKGDQSPKEHGLYDQNSSYGSQRILGHSPPAGVETAKSFQTDPSVMIHNTY